MTRVQFEPRSFDQGRRKNYAFTHLASLPTILDHCNQFSEIVRRNAPRNIPRECYTNYIPSPPPTARQMYSTCNNLYECDPFSSKTIVAGQETNNAISQQRQSIWQTTAGGINMARNSRKAWNLFGKLKNDNT